MSSVLLERPRDVSSSQTFEQRQPEAMERLIESVDARIDRADCRRTFICLTNTIGVVALCAITRPILSFYKCMRVVNSCDYPHPSACETSAECHANLVLGIIGWALVSITCFSAACLLCVKTNRTHQDPE